MTTGIVVEARTKPFEACYELQAGCTQSLLSLCCCWHFTGASLCRGRGCRLGERGQGTRGNPAPHNSGGRHHFSERRPDGIAAFDEPMRPVRSSPTWSLSRSSDQRNIPRFGVSAMEIGNELLHVVRISRRGIPLTHQNDRLV